MKKSAILLISLAFSQISFAGNDLQSRINQQLHKQQPQSGSYNINAPSKLIYAGQDMARLRIANSSPITEPTVPSRSDVVIT